MNPGHGPGKVTNIGKSLVLNLMFLNFEFKLMFWFIVIYEFYQ